MSRKMVLLVGLSLATFACSNDDQSNPAGPRGAVDTNGFVNTVDEQGFKAKGKEALGIFDSAEKSFGQVGGASFNLNGLSQLTQSTEIEREQCEESKEYVDTEVDDQGNYIDVYTCNYVSSDGYTMNCTIKEGYLNNSTQRSCTSGGVSSKYPSDSYDQDDHSTDGDSSQMDIDTSIIDEFSGEIESCEEAFKAIKGMYSQSKSELEEALASLQDPALLTSEADGLSLTKAEKSADADSAIAYNITTPEKIDGVSINGQIKGGANDNLLVISMNMDMMIDFEKLLATYKTQQVQKMLQGQVSQTQPDEAPKKLQFKQQMQIAADLNKQLIDYSSIGSIKQDDEATNWDAIITVAGGQSPGVDMKFNFNGNGESASLIMNVAMVDENTLTIRGSALSGSSSFTQDVTIVKDENGLCTVK